MTQVFDAFGFSDELDLLEAHMEVLSGVVDVFVIVEANMTYTGRPKLLHLRDNWERFAKYHDQMIHVIVEDLPPNEPGSDPVAMAWLRDHSQRSGPHHCSSSSSSCSYQ